MPNNGLCFVSTYKSSGANALKSTSDRFGLANYTSLLVPGPGKYNHLSPVNKIGSNFVSKYESSSSRKFGNSARITEFDIVKSIFCLLLLYRNSWAWCICCSFRVRNLRKQK